MQLAFWGTRGAIPVPGIETAKYGGDTPCVEVTLTDGRSLILDAGSGLRKLGLRLLERPDKKRLSILISHFHLDHIIGFPFFAPAFKKGWEIELYGRPCSEAQRILQGRPGENKNLREVFDDLLRPPYSSLRFEDFAAEVRLVELPPDGRAFSIGGARIEMIRANHPGLCYGYRLTEAKCRVVYLTDNEVAPPGDAATSFEALVRFAWEADLLIHDTYFRDAEYETGRGLGHSSFGEAVRLAKSARVKQLAFFHYNVAHTDDFLDEEIDRQIQELNERKETLRVFGSWEGCRWIFTG